MHYTLLAAISHHILSLGGLLGLMLSADMLAHVVGVVGPELAEDTSVVSVNNLGHLMILNINVKV